MGGTLATRITQGPSEAIMVIILEVRSSSISRYISFNLADLGDHVHPQVPVVRNTVCKDAGLRLKDHHVCAGGEYGKGSCRVDSGGRLFVRKTEYGVDGEVESPWYLLGIVSFGGQDCGICIPYVYT